MMEPSGGVLMLIAVVIGASDHFIEKMQRAWARPAPHEPRKRHALDNLRRSMTPAIAGFILDSILAVEITEDRKRAMRDEESATELDIDITKQDVRARIS